MAVILVGEVVNTADATTGFNAGNISGDDDFVQGTGAIGLKVSATASEMYTTSLGTTAPYDFSSTGSESGYHIVMWFNTKSPIDATAGFRIIVGNGTSRGHWNVVPSGFYKGGFVTRVVNSARAFDSIAAGSWTTGGNPGQLTNVTQMGGLLQTPASIMGSFNNFQLDQFTIGLGLRISGGTTGAPNTFEQVRVQDEDTSKWGWWSSANGSYVGKGKLYIGPFFGPSTSVFSDTAFSVNFANEKVASDFYEIRTRGAGTSVLWNLGSINSADADTVRWGLTIDNDTGFFADVNGVWVGGRNLILNSNSTLSGTTLINCNKLYQSGATFDGVTVIGANTSSGSAFIVSNAPQLMSNCDFNYSTGHTIEFTSDVPTAFTFSNNTFNGSYGANGSNEAAIYNNSGKAIVINVSGGDTPTYRNGTGASTTVNNTVTLTLTNIVSDSEVRIYSAGTRSEIAGQESVTGGTFQFSYTYAANYLVDIVVFKETYLFNEPEGRIRNFELPNGNSSIPINQTFDRNYNNP